MTHPLDAIPELAGIATYAAAASIGYSVDENVRRLLRFHWIERRLMASMIAHVASEPVWEVKCALSLHQWHCAEHVEALRKRISEMRNPAPRLDVAPDDDQTSGALATFLEELIRSENTIELLVGFYRVALPALGSAYEVHVANTNPLVDYPTRRILQRALPDLGDAIAWGERALSVVIAQHESGERIAQEWTTHLQACLDAAGGVSGTDAASVAPSNLRSQRPFTPNFHPQRDERFHGRYNTEFAPHSVYAMPEVSVAERNLALLCKRTLEMDVPEMMASFITQRANEPWEFYYDYSRQLWDEARHSMMGSVALTARGIDWRAEIPLNVTFGLRLNLHAEPIERQMMLFDIEQSLMPADTGKRYEFETAREAGDELSAHFHDYDWADEVLHAQIGRRALKRDGISSQEAQSRAREIHERTWAALEGYKHLDEQHDWWPAFVQRVLGVRR
jgi:hypothetical protein